MKKILILLLGILVAKSNLNAIEYKDATDDQKKIFDSLVESVNQKKDLELFINLLGSSIYLHIPEISSPNLVEKISKDKYEKYIEKNFDYVKTILIYSMLEEVIQQVKAKTKIKRFDKIVKILDKIDFEKNNLTPKEVKEILAIKPKTKNSKKPKLTAFYWYLYKKIILKDKIKTDCLKSSLKYFLDRLRLSILNEKIEDIKTILNDVPFLIGLKINDLYLKAFIEKHVKNESTQKAILIEINNVKEKLNKLEPSTFTALLRYKWF